MEYFLSFILVSVSTISTGQFCDAFLKRKSLRIPYFFCIVLYSLVETSFLAFWNFQPLNKYGFNILLCFVFTLLVYYGKVFKKLFVAIFFFALAGFLELAVALPFSAIADRSIEQLRLGSVSFVFGAGIYSLLLLMITLVIKKLSLSHPTGYALTYKEWIRLLLFPAISILLIVTIYEESVLIQKTTMLMLLSLVGLLVANVAVRYLVDALDQQQKAKEDKILLERQIELEMNNSKELVELNDTQRSLSHDYVNKITALSHLLANGNYDEAREYTSRLCQEVQGIQCVISSNNPLVDAILNVKYLVAKRNHVLMQFHVNDLSGFPLRNEELVIVLANLLDNAIEACLRVPDKPEIRVKIQYGKDESILSVMNTVCAPIKITDNMVQSTKGNNRHGYGLSNIKTVLDRYGYEYALACEDGWFQFTTILN